MECWYDLSFCSNRWLVGLAFDCTDRPWPCGFRVRFDTCTYTSLSHIEERRVAKNLFFFLLFLVFRQKKKNFKTMRRGIKKFTFFIISRVYASIKVWDREPRMKYIYNWWIGPWLIWRVVFLVFGDWRLRLRLRLYTATTLLMGNHEIPPPNCLSFPSKFNNSKRNCLKS